MNVVLIIICRRGSNLLSTYANEPKFWIYMGATKYHHVTTVSTERNIYWQYYTLKRNLYCTLQIVFDNFTDQKCSFYSGP